MKLTLKLFLVVCLFSSIAFAEGDMTSGGFTNGDMTSGKSCPQGQQTCRPAEHPPETTGNDSILTIIQKYLISIFE